MYGFGIICNKVYYYMEKVFIVIDWYIDFVFVWFFLLICGNFVFIGYIKYVFK